MRRCYYVAIYRRRETNPRIGIRRTRGFSFILTKIFPISLGKICDLHKKSSPARPHGGIVFVFWYSVVCRGRVPAVRSPPFLQVAARSCLPAFRCHRLHPPARLPIPVPRRRYRFARRCFPFLRARCSVFRTMFDEGEGSSRLHLLYGGLITHAASVRCRAFDQKSI